MASDDVLSWLRATIEGDKAAAEAATPGPWTVDEPSDRESGLEIEAPDVMVAGRGHYGGGVWRQADADHIALHDPRDTIARCETELEILDDHAEAKAFYDRHLAAPAGELHGLRSAIKRLASGYRNRPGFNPEWVSD